VKRFSGKNCGKNKGLEQFLKSVKRFSDKNCGKNKELEQLGEPNETKTALERQTSPSEVKTALRFKD